MPNQICALDGYSDAGLRLRSAQPTIATLTGCFPGQWNLTERAGRFLEALKCKDSGDAESFDLTNHVGVESRQLGKAAPAFGVIVELVEAWRAG